MILFRQSIQSHTNINNYFFTGQMPYISTTNSVSKLSLAETPIEQILQCERPSTNPTA